MGVAFDEQGHEVADLAAAEVVVRRHHDDAHVAARNVRVLPGQSLDDLFDELTFLIRAYHSSIVLGRARGGQWSTKRKRKARLSQRNTDDRQKVVHLLDFTCSFSVHRRIGLRVG